MYGGKGVLKHLGQHEAEHVGILDQLTTAVARDPLLIDREGEMSEDAVFSSACARVAIRYSANARSQNCEGLAHVLKTMFSHFGFHAEAKDVYTDHFLVDFEDFAEPVFTGNVFDTTGDVVEGLVRFASHRAVLAGNLYYDLTLKESYSATEFSERACFLRKKVELQGYTVYLPNGGAANLVPNDHAVVVNENMILSSGLSATMLVPKKDVEAIRNVDDDDDLDEWKESILEMKAGAEKDEQKKKFGERKKEIQKAATEGVAALKEKFDLINQV